jgi:hypothetical protein
MFLLTLRFYSNAELAPKNFWPLKLSVFWTFLAGH